MKPDQLRQIDQLRGKRAAIYMRVSSPGQEQTYSLPEQQADSMRFAEEIGVVVHEEHIINDGWQRSYTLNRPGIHRIKELFRTRQIDLLIVAKYDRLSRSQLQQGALLYELEQVRGGRVISAHPSERYDDSPEGRLLRSIGGYRAEKEREDIIWRTQGGRHARARDGKIGPTKHPLYGYMWADLKDKSRYVPDPATFPVVVRIYHEAGAGKSLQKIAEGLMADRIPSPAHYARGVPGGNWHRYTIRLILANSAYIGEYVAYQWSRKVRIEHDGFGNELVVNETRKRAADDPLRVVLGPEICPPLVEKPLFLAVQDQLRRNFEESPRNNRYPESGLLRCGRIVCGHCGGKLYVKRVAKSGGYSYGKLIYCCSRPPKNPSGHCSGGSTSIKVEKMDDDVLFLVGYLFTHPSVVKEAMLRLRDSYTPEIDQLETRLQSVEGRIQQLRDEADELLATKRMAKSAQAQAFLAKRLDELFEEIEGLEAERKVQTTIAQKWEDIDVRMSSYEQWATQMAQIIQDATYQWKRAALAFLGLTVTVSNRKTSPRYRMNCTLGGVQSYFAADSDQIARLREGRMSIYDMYDSSYVRSQ